MNKEKTMNSKPITDEELKAFQQTHNEEVLSPEASEKLMKILSSKNNKPTEFMKNFRRKQCMINKPNLIIHNR